MSVQNIKNLALNGTVKNYTEAVNVFKAETGRPPSFEEVIELNDIFDNLAQHTIDAYAAEEYEFEGDEEYYSSSY